MADKQTDKSEIEKQKQTNPKAFVSNTHACLND